MMPTSISLPPSAACPPAANLRRTGRQFAGRGGLPQACRAGFTLVEILMAIAISVLILGAASIFMYSAFSMLEQTQNDPGLEHHKLGVTNFLAYSFATALPDSAIPVNPNQNGNTTAGGTAAGNSTSGNSTSGASTSGASTSGTSSSATSSLSSPMGVGNTTTSRAPGVTMASTVNAINANTTGNSTTGATTSGNSTSGNSTSGASTSANSTAGSSDDSGAANNNPSAIQKTTLVSWGWPPSVDVGEDPSLTWVMNTDDPILVWDNGPRPPIRCFLSFKEHEGLELIWVPPYTPDNIEINAVRRTLLSPLVVKMTYVYYDAQSLTWDTSDSPPKDPSTGSYVIPDYIRLFFDLNGKTSQMDIPIPAAAGTGTVPIY